MRRSAFAWLAGTCLLVAGLLAAQYTMNRGRLSSSPTADGESRSPAGSAEAESKHAPSAAEAPAPPLADPKPKDIQR